jgi:hypothetical protein
MPRQKKTAAGGEMSSASRRRFLSYLGSAPGLMGLGGAGLLSTLDAPRALGDTGPLDAMQRRRRAFVIRRDAAIAQRDRTDQTSTSNGDEQLYPNRIALNSFAVNDRGSRDIYRLCRAGYPESGHPEPAGRELNPGHPARRPGPGRSECPH